MKKFTISITILLFCALIFSGFTITPRLETEKYGLCLDMYNSCNIDVQVIRSWEEYQDFSNDTVLVVLNRVFIDDRTKSHKESL